MATLDKNTVLKKALRASEIIGNKLGVPSEELAQYLTAIAYVESTFKDDATNKSSTARGLPQVLINTQRWIEVKLNVAHPVAMYKASKYPKTPTTPYKEDDAMFNPDYALLIGAYYLGYNYIRYNDWYKAITAYHLGSYNSKSSDGTLYKNKVLNAFEKLDLGTPIKRSVSKKVPIRIIEANGQKLYYRNYY